MLIITLRTDKPEAEIGLYEGEKKLQYEKWIADRELSTTIHQKIHDILKSASKQMEDLNGVVCFAGPGSFTGLRIGITVGNAMSYGLSIPIVATTGEDWIESGIKKLIDGKSDKIALPQYGSEAHTTVQKK